MALNVVWIGVILLGFGVALVRLAQGDLTIFPQVLTGIFDTAKTGFDISLGLVGVMSLWLGVMKIGERAGVIGLFARAVSPLFVRLFPGIPKGHPAGGSIVMNFSANMLGLDNAAMPLGPKAMRELQEINPDKHTASDAMVMFLVLNTSGITLIPSSAIAILVAISVFRSTGCMDYLVGAIAAGVAAMGLPTDFVPALPVGLMKTLSGSGARDLMVDVMKTYGVDSFQGWLAAIIQGSTETTF